MSEPVTETQSNVKKASFFSSLTQKKCYTLMQGASVLMLIIAILLYLLAAMNFWLIAIEGGLALALAFIWQRASERRAGRVIIRSLILTLLTLVLLSSVAIMLYLLSDVSAYDSTLAAEFLQAQGWPLLAVFLLPPFLFFQPTLVVMAGQRHTIDAVTLRIVSILTLILTLLLCIFALSYSSDGGAIITSVTYTPKILGQEMNITIAIDNILTRIIFCLCSAVMVVLSFRLKAEPRVKIPKLAKTQRA